MTIYSAESFSFAPYYEFMLNFNNDFYTELNARGFGSDLTNNFVDPFSDILTSQRYATDMFFNRFVEPIASLYLRYLEYGENYVPFGLENWNMSNSTNSWNPWTIAELGKLLPKGQIFADMQDPKFFCNLINILRNTHIRKIATAFPVYVYKNESSEPYYSTFSLRKGNWGGGIWVRYPNPHIYSYLKYFVSFIYNEPIRFNVKNDPDHQVSNFNTNLSCEETNYAYTTERLTGEEPYYKDIARWIKINVGVDGIQLYRTPELCSGVRSYNENGKAPFPSILINDDPIDFSGWITSRGGTVNNPPVPIII